VQLLSISQTLQIGSSFLPQPDYNYPLASLPAYQLGNASVNVASYVDLNGKVFVETPSPARQELVLKTAYTYNVAQLPVEIPVPPLLSPPSQCYYNKPPCRLEWSRTGQGLSQLQTPTTLLLATSPSAPFDVALVGQGNNASAPRLQYLPTAGRMITVGDVAAPYTGFVNLDPTTLGEDFVAGTAWTVNLGAPLKQSSRLPLRPRGCGVASICCVYQVFVANGRFASSSPQRLEVACYNSSGWIYTGPRCEDAQNVGVSVGLGWLSAVLCFVAMTLVLYGDHATRLTQWIKHKVGGRSSLSQSGAYWSSTPEC
jgi:hypothetical protein